METHGIELLAASVAALAAGPLLYHLADRWRPAVFVVHGFVVLGILALVGLHILPECVEMAGWFALVVAAVGFVGPTIAERKLRGAFRDTHSITLGGKTVHAIALALGFFGLALHAFTDGLALVDGHAHEHAELMNLGALAVVLHRIPVGALLFFLLRPYGKAAVVLALLLDTASMCAGYVIGQHVILALDGVGVALFQAFVGGVLLHVILHGRHEKKGVAVAHAHREA